MIREKKSLFLIQSDPDISKWKLDHADYQATLENIIISDQWDMAHLSDLEAIADLYHLNLIDLSQQTVD
ncbi:hypothetical protein HZI73_04655 [Vallitalea pronyensis]|uniref:Uncharacterized protein n=1 Tax=Vallitalea pronyensis TaxID=1348613 RepID=A0A8J8SFI6_9FIRM|nr:hypothetical protein [Vallitalea pronyensis]QUI21626.1 hypothetical protein HZI73_04655 [Vallitalea pronyensis]